MGRHADQVTKGAGMVCYAISTRWQSSDRIGERLFMRRLVVLGLVLIALGPVALGLVGNLRPVLADTPSGPVVLTIAGAIDRPNRGPFDAFDDAYLNVLGVEFSRAARFDRAALLALPQHTITTGYPSWPRVYTFTGPLMRDVLAAAGATGETVRVHALDGYTREMAVAEFERWPVLLALTRDDMPLGLGGYGPAWVIWPRDGDPELEARDGSMFVWSVVFIAVE